MIFFISISSKMYKKNIDFSINDKCHIRNNIEIK